MPVPAPVQELQASAFAFKTAEWLENSTPSRRDGMRAFKETALLWEAALLVERASLHFRNWGRPLCATNTLPQCIRILPCPHRLHQDTSIRCRFDVRECLESSAKLCHCYFPHAGVTST